MRTKVTLVLIFLNIALFTFIYHFAGDEKPKDYTRRPLPRAVAGADRIEILQADASQLLLTKRNDRWMLGAPYEWPADRNAVDRLLNELLLLESETSFNVAELANTGQKLSDYGLQPPAITLRIGAGSQHFDLGIGAATQVQNRLYVLDPDGSRIHVVSRSLIEALQLGADKLRDDNVVDIPVFEARSLAIQLPAPNNQRVRLARRDGSEWIFESPFQTRADKNAVELALGRIHDLRITGFLDKPSDTRKTGLDTPSYRLAIEGNQRRAILLLGAPVSTEPIKGVSRAEADYYAKLEDRAAVFTVKVEDSLIDTLRSAQTELRDRHLLNFDPARLNAVTLEAPGQPEIVLERLETGGWQMRTRQDTAVRPQPADPQIMARVIEKLTQLRAESFHSDAPFPADLEAWGFNRPVREVLLAFAADNRNAASSTTLQVGVTADTGQIPLAYAKLSDAQFVYKVRAAVLDELPVSARYYRLRTLRELPPGAAITGVTLRRLSDNSTVYSQSLTKGQTWESVLAASKPEVQGPVQQLLSELRNLRAQDFVADNYTEVPQIDGRPQPWAYQLEISIALTSSGETAAKVTTSMLMLGERQGGGTILAGSQEFDTVFRATQPLLDAVFALTFGSRDPGMPPASTSPAPASSIPAPIPTSTPTTAPLASPSPAPFTPSQ
jgi:hypothetical protein